MKNKIYPFLLGLSCIVIVALVSFKNNEKVSEKERMVVVAKGADSRNLDLYISTMDNYDNPLIEGHRELHNYTSVLKEVDSLEKAGWKINNTNLSEEGLYFLLERDKK